MDTHLEDKVALVTGGSRGLGAAIAAALASAGARVVATSRKGPAPDEAKAPKGGEVTALRLDVRDPESVQEAFAWLDDGLGGLDVAVINAGSGHFGPLHELSVDAWREMVDTNLTGAFLCLREALPRLAKRGGGRVIQIGSIADHRPLPNSAAYGATKAGLHMMGRVLAEEWKEQGVRVTHVAPGPIATDIWKGVPGFDLADMLKPEEVARTVLHVAATPLSIRLDEVKLYPPSGAL